MEVSAGSTLGSRVAGAVLATFSSAMMSHNRLGIGGDPVVTETQLTPAAEYVRASTERQQYSIEYQSRAIAQYAETHGFKVVRTFSDEARSGLDLKYRPALSQLLAEVMAGDAPFRAILVFDVSRWGRFQDADEAAHYEYMCKSTGIPVHYCAEQFSNIGGISDSLLKALKRFMAGEFSRDLSARASGGLNNIVERGFKYGSVPGYGLRRMLVGSDGRCKQLLAVGELKNISSDRVVLVPGPSEELAVVQDIYRQFVEHKKSMRQIVRDLNGRNIPWTGGRRWTPTVLKRILSHPKYVGSLIFNRTEKKLHSHARPTSRSKWIVKNQAFEAVVDPKLFAEAQHRLRSFPRHKSDEQLIGDIQRLLHAKGRLSLGLMRQTTLRKSLGIACPTTYFNRLGPLNRIYQLAGYESPEIYKSRARTNAQRHRIMEDLATRFPDDVQRIEGKNKFLMFGGNLKIAIRVCRSCRLKNSERRWTLGGCDGVSIVLAATMNEENTDPEALFLLPSVPEGRYWIHANSPILTTGIRLRQLSELPEAMKIVSAQE